jgi:xylose isomerase
MAKWKFALVPAFMGKLSDRFSAYGQTRSLAEKMALASQVRGAKGLELIFPSEFTDVSETKRLLEQYKLSASTVNVNLKSEEKFHLGSLTSRDAGIRREAVSYMKRGMDIAAEVGSNLISMCPLADGFDYAFQSDYVRAWRWFLDGIGEAASYRKDVKVSLEYKLSEPRNHVILPNAGIALSVCLEVGMPNVGVTMDMGHALMAHESPAQSAAILAESGRLFLVHVNDNYREWDWDLIPGSVSPWELVESMFYLRLLNYTGWLTADVAPFRLDPVKVCLATYRSLTWADKVIDRLGFERIQKLIRKGDPIGALAALQKEVAS